MLKEDADHGKIASKPFDQLSKNDRIGELIFQLRDQNELQLFKAGACQVCIQGNGPQLIPSPSETADSPANKLVKMGFDAVPQLLDHLDDQRLHALSRNGLGAGKLLFP